MRRWLRSVVRRWRERNAVKCAECDVPAEVSMRLMGDVVPYEWLRCPCCEREGWGARL